MNYDLLSLSIENLDYVLNSCLGSISGLRII